MSWEEVMSMVGGGKLKLPDEDPIEFSPDLIDPVQIPQSVWPSLRQQWNHVRTHFRLNGRMQDLFVFRLQDRILSPLEVADNARLAFLTQSVQFRFNISFAFVLVQKSTEASDSPEMRIFYASNNSGHYEAMPWIMCQNDIEYYHKQLALSDIYEDVSERLPNTKWKIKSFVSMTVYIAKMEDKLY
ncbi:MAG: hypothetical protein AAF298_16800 [Cyanobacteria bacterium P01_A01_bin.40]